MSGKVYTNNFLIKIRNEAQKQRVFKETLLKIEQFLIKSIEEGKEDVFITEKFLGINSLITYTDYIIGLKQIFPDTEIAIKEVPSRPGKGIHIIFGL